MNNSCNIKNFMIISIPWDNLRIKVSAWEENGFLFSALKSILKDVIFLAVPQNC